MYGRLTCNPPVKYHDNNIFFDDFLYILVCSETLINWQVINKLHINSFGLVIAEYNLNSISSLFQIVGLSTALPIIDPLGARITTLF